MIPCIRCGKKIEKPSAGNAKYITNNSDVRTHGSRNISKFQVKKGSEVLKTFKKFEDAVKDHEKETGKIDTEIKKKSNEVEVLGIEYENIANTPEKKSDKDSKFVEFSTKNNELMAKHGERNSIKLIPIEVTESVPKTAIICRDEKCQNINDTIIWG